MEMLSYSNALALIKSIALKHSLSSEKVNISNALGRVCASDTTAKLSIQPFDNSAMDGFMVLVDDLKNASKTNPVILKNDGIVQAGKNTSFLKIKNGCCMQVMTGAKVAENAEAVVAIEDVKVKGNDIYFYNTAKVCQNIRKKGQDIKKGQLALAKNTKIEPKHIALLASLGVFEINVYKSPKILFLSTGNELVTKDTKKLEKGQIYNSNLYYALAYFKALGIENVEHKTLCDNKEEFKKVVKDALTRVDFIVSSGAVSAGKFDFVRKSLEELNAKIVYHKLKLRPGKPNLFAFLPNEVAYFGLPGNPMASIVGLRFFVTYYISCLQNKKQEQASYAICSNDFTTKEGFSFVLRGNLFTNEQGVNNVYLPKEQDSFMVNSFSKSNCFVFINEEVSTIKKGQVVKIYPLLP